MGMNWKGMLSPMHFTANALNFCKILVIKIYVFEMLS